MDFFSKNYSLWIFNTALVVSCPHLFVALHMYSPASLGKSQSISRTTNPKSSTVWTREPGLKIKISKCISEYNNINFENRRNRAKILLFKEKFWTLSFVYQCDLKKRKTDVYSTINKNEMKFSKFIYRFFILFIFI